MDENKKKALDAAVMQIEKDFGRGAVMRLGDTSAFGEVEVVPTGALSLDIALGAWRRAAGQSGGNLRTGVQR